MGALAGWEMAGVTHVGRVRRHNEDAIAWDSNLGLAVLADGMGGHNAGEIASRLAVQRIECELRAALLSPEWGRDGGDVGTGYAALVEHVVRRVNHGLKDVVLSRPECAGMGTTLALGLFRDATATIAHVGDSRAYRLRQDQLRQLTVDHSLVQELIKHGYLTEEEARVSEHRNVITRALGVDPDVEVDIQQHAVQPADLFLLCSDGLTNLVRDLDIEAQLRRAQALEETAHELVKMANERGGYDNISVILVRAK